MNSKARRSDPTLMLAIFAGALLLAAWSSLSNIDPDRLRDLADLGARGALHLREELGLALPAPCPLAARSTTCRGPASGSSARPTSPTRAETAQRVLHLLALGVELGEPFLEQVLCLLYRL